MHAKLYKSPYSLASYNPPITYTGVNVKSGDTIRIIGTGKIDFGYGIGLLDADGLSDTRTDRALPEYPSSTSRMHSLVCRLDTDDSKYYQGGKDEIFVVSGGGQLTLSINNPGLGSDAVGYWMIFVQVVEGVDGKPTLLNGKQYLMTIGILRSGWPQGIYQ